ncbi:MAG TPA: GGDEF domain-containing protein [Pseudonocardiaceae bacterium]|nr:GGDEF domain-containing protein [Pseudonocardiaceae bacterium]
MTRLRRAVTAWPLWSLPKVVLSTVLGVELLAVTVTAATVARFPVHTHDWMVFGILTACSVIHLELVRGIERIREGVRTNTPLVDLKSAWTFAGVLLLPPALAVTLAVVSNVQMRVRVAPRETFRWVYTGATIVLATQASAAVLYVGQAPGAYPGLPVSWHGVAIIVLAAVVRWFVNHGLIVTIILLSSPQTPGKDALGSFSDNIVEAAALSLGAVTALVVTHDPWYMALVLPPMLVLHRSLLMRQYELAARTDNKTGLANAVYWSQVARAELGRAERDGATVGIVMIDLDHFKQVNDTYGHLTGDAVLKAVADALGKQTRGYDLVGRFGGEEFMILLPGHDPMELPTTVERIRHSINDLHVVSPDTHERVTITASAGVVTFPDGGQNLDELLLAADAALYRAKEQGRDRTCFAPAASPDLPSARQPDD